MERELVLPAYPKERTGDAGVVKIELRRFHQPLIEITVVRLEAIEDEGTLQDR
jgi:hypothetical protein